MRQPKIRWSKRIENNILRVYHAASDQDRQEGMYWYQTALEDCQRLAERYGISVVQAVGVVAALSPGNQWGRNLLDADILISEWRNGKVAKVGVYGKKNVKKAIRILKGGINPLDVLGDRAFKTKAFYSNILNPMVDVGVVTIDRHAKAIAENKPSDRTGKASAEKFATVSPREYGYYSKYYRVLAEHLGLLASQLQAITWVTWRRLSGEIPATN